MHKFGLAIATLILGSSFAQGGEKGLMHCFAFSPIPTATPAEWEAFYKATDAIPKQMKFVKNVWAGKLRGPMNVYSIANAEQRNKALAGEKVTTEVTGMKREYGACFWFTGGPEVLKQYTDHPYHKVWSAAYEKVRIAGTSTYDIIAQ